MSTPVTYVGNAYNVPAYQDTGYAQGTGNLSSYLIALATGSLTLSGGTFTLTADTDFGANFGLKSLYYKSRATNLSSAGILRLGNTDTIGWRDNANANNIVIACNATQTGGATYTIPDTGQVAANFVMTQGIQTINGAKTFGSGITVAAGQNVSMISGSSQFLASDGSNTAPCFSWVNEAGAGIYRNASHDFRYRVNSVDSLIVKDTGVQVKGQSSNTAAAAGYIGEIISSDATVVNTPASTVRGDLANVVLTAGNWLISGHVYFSLNGATCTAVEAGISDTAGNNTTNTTFGIDRLDGPPPTGSYGSTIYIDAKPVSLAGSATYYLKFAATFTPGQPQARGHLLAIRTS